MSTERDGKGRKGRRRGSQEGRGRRQGAGLGNSLQAGICLCPSCGYSQPHQRGEPCRRRVCPECRASLVREKRFPGAETRERKEGSIMKLVITSKKEDPEGEFQERFGRCGTFLCVDTQTGTWQAYDNPAAEVRGGAGPRAVQFLADRHVDAVISGRFGPQAFQALGAADIKAYQASGGTPRELYERYQRGELSEVEAASGPGFHQS